MRCSPNGGWGILKLCYGEQGFLECGDVSPLLTQWRRLAAQQSDADASQSEGIFSGRRAHLTVSGIARAMP